MTEASKAPLLTAKVNGEALCDIFEDVLPAEALPSRKLDAGARLDFADNQGQIFSFGLGQAGWHHFSIRVHPNLACQADCVITDSEAPDPAAFTKGAPGIRFQPFFLSGAKVVNEHFAGRGLFTRGLHFSGSITLANVTLGCLCDHCRRSFLVTSFHSGFGNVGYFYSDSGLHTLTVDNNIPGCPSALVEPDQEALAALEVRLPKAPDGTSFHYMNPFRCPHCSKPYIDCQRYPEDRSGEYYGNYLVGTDPLHYSG